MAMKKEYGRNQKKYKEYIHPRRFLTFGMDVSKPWCNNCKGTLGGALHMLRYVLKNGGLFLFFE